MDRSLASLMSAILLLEIGSGLQGVLIPVRAEIAGFPTEIIGVLGTLHYVGFVLGCVRLPALVRRIGHVRSFSALSAIAASSVLFYALAEIPVAWMGLRVAIGFCFAGLFMVTESWLNDRATTDTRGSLLGKYMLATWIGVIIGKMVYSLASPESFQHFSLVAVAITISMVPLAVTNGAVPTIPQPSRIGLAEVYQLAPTGFIGCLVVGLANSAFWTFGPLFARNEIGIGAPVSLFMAACVVGGAALQWPMGRISDGTDRRWVIACLCLASALVGLSLACVPASSTLQTYGLGFLFGAASLSLYSLCVAHANDHADPSGYIDVSSSLLLVFGLGALAGPFFAGLIIPVFGYPSLFLLTGGAETILAAFVLVNIRLAPRVPKEEQASFVSQPPLSHGTQAIAELQPMDTPIGENSAKPDE